MRRLKRLTWIWLILLGSFATASAGEPGWLDVADCGASGSAYQTTAATGPVRRDHRRPGRRFQGRPGRARVEMQSALRTVHPQPPENPYGTSPLGDAAELRGYDGSGGSWMIFLVEVNSADPLTFRWSDDMARSWKGDKVPVTFDWQPLSGGVEIKFKKQAWQPGHMITFQARDHLLTRIERIEGNRLTLAEPAGRAVADAALRHCDSEALQQAVARALKEKRNVFFPAGHYRLMTGLTVASPEGIVLEGASGGQAVLDISEGHGTCVSLAGGSEAAVRNLCMVGHTALGDGPGWHSFRTSSGKACWPVGLKPCSAMHIRNTERVLVENCHASKMNCEAFYCQGDSRSGAKEPRAYTRSLTYLRCSATNCDGNGFNNNDLAENTSVLYCRIVDVGGCSWEGASRFVRFIGNYVRNSGTVAMGNIGSRAEHLEQLGSGQHIVADNVFEGRTFYNGRPGGYIVRATCGATQVIVRNNLFVNYNSCAVEIVPGGDTRHLPTSNCTITGNILDMTAVGEPSRPRTAIHVGSSDVIVSDNQVYVRGSADANVTAIRLTEPAVNLIVHDNLLRNCGTGLVSDTAFSYVGEIVDAKTWSGRGSALERDLCRYRGWNLAFRGDDKQAFADRTFDPARFQEPRETNIGDRFEVFAPSANWLIHDNIITGCRRPFVLDSYGSETTLVKDNIVTRGETTDARVAVELRGRFDLVGNHISGFDEKDATALALWPDRFGKPCGNLYRGNVIQRCFRAVAENAPGLWAASTAEGNEFIACGGVPAAKQ